MPVSRLRKKHKQRIKTRNRKNQDLHSRFKKMVERINANQRHLENDDTSTVAETQPGFGFPNAIIPDNIGADTTFVLNNQEPEVTESIEIIKNTI